MNNRNEELKKLISECLRERADSYPIQQLLNQFPATAELMDVTEQQLMSIKGIGMGKARQLTALLKLAKNLTIPTYEQTTIRSPKDAFDLLEPELRYVTKEHFICLFLNTKNRVIFKEIISIGSLNAAIVHPREVFRAAIKRCSASLICAHNHPSGDPNPSPEDVELIKRLARAGENCGHRSARSPHNWRKHLRQSKRKRLNVKNKITLETIGKYMYIILINGFSTFDMELAISAKGSIAAKYNNFALAANNNKHFDADTGQLPRFMR